LYFRLADLEKGVQLLSTPGQNSDRGEVTVANWNLSTVWPALGLPQ